MFGSSTLSLPSPFANDHHPLRASAESTRPQPSGGCNFLLVQPSAKSKICACQVYHHNRSAPGNVCDCGHSACFHVHTFGDKAVDGANGVKIDTAEKIRKLEEMIIAERRARETDRREWQREIKTILEALNSFYRSESEMRRKLTQLEVTSSHAADEHRHLNEFMTSAGSYNLARSKDIDVAGASHTPDGQIRAVTSHSTDDIPGLTSGDDRSSTSSFSRHRTPSETMPTLVEPDSPRSSGILNLVSHPRPSVTPTYIVPRPVTQLQEEPRSSGFLGVDVGKRYPAVAGQKRRHQSLISLKLPGPMDSGLFDSRNTKSPRREGPLSQGRLSHGHLSSSLSPIQSTSSRSLPRPSPPMNGIHNATRFPPVIRATSPPGKLPAASNIMPRTGSSIPFMALDVLANVSTATTGMN